MPPNEVGEEEERAAPPLDIKSRIAAFSQATVPQQASPRGGQATLRRTPSTSQLLPAWQQRQQQQQELQTPSSAALGAKSSDSLLKPGNALLGRPRSLTGEQRWHGNRGQDSTTPPTTTADTADAESSMTPKLGVKGIIALYGQDQRQGEASRSASSSPGLELARRRQGGEEEASLASGVGDFFKRPPPPPPSAPALPPRPRHSALSQSNTGSSTTSSSSNSVSGGGHTGSPSSGYTPYVRRNAGNAGLQSQSPATSSSGTINGPALPPRSWAVRSSDDLTLPTSEHASARPTTTTGARRGIGAGPKWASSSSGNLTMHNSEGNGRSDWTSTSNSPLAPPAVPPRVSTTSTASNGGTLAPPPQRAPLAPMPQTPPSISNAARVSRSTSGPVSASGSGAMGAANGRNGGGGGGSSSNGSGHAPRSSLSSIPMSSASTVIAPPPRHIDARRLGPGTHVSTSSTSSTRSVKARQTRGNKKRLSRAGLVYSKEASEAEEARYAFLFDRQLSKQQQQQQQLVGAGRATTTSATLGKRAVVRIWSQSRLEDWFLARVWDQAAGSSPQSQGIAKPSFVRAMSAIDSELLRRKVEREVRNGLVT